MVEKFERGDVLAVASNSLLGKFIRSFTFGNVNHVALVINETECIEAKGNTGIVIVPIQEVLERKAKIYLCKLKNEYRNIINENENQFNYCVNYYNGTKYGFFSALFAGLDTYFKNIPFKSLNGRLCCSALVASIYKGSGLKMKDNPTEYTPDEIFNSELFGTKTELNGIIQVVEEAA